MPSPIDPIVNCTQIAVSKYFYFIFLSTCVSWMNMIPLKQPDPLVPFHQQLQHSTTVSLLAPLKALYKHKLNPSITHSTATLLCYAVTATGRLNSRKF